MLVVEQYARICELYYRQKKSQREIAELLGRSRRTVKKAIELRVPPGYRRNKAPQQPTLEQFIPIIDAWIKEDKHRQRKQRHSAQRVYERLRDEYQFKGHASTVRRYMAKRKATSGEVYFPLVFAPGEEGQVDWGQAWCNLNGVPTKVWLFCMRLCHSTASFVYAYPCEIQEAFLDGHVRAFEFFGGVPRRAAYDNLKSAVITVGTGQERELTAKFKELRAYYVFESRFCNVASGNEKGHVENLVKHAQRTFMTPLPAVRDMEELNRHLAEECRKDFAREVASRGATRQALFTEEQAALLPVPAVPFDACVKESTVVSKQALVRLDTNDYSVPVRWALHPVLIKGYVDRVEIWAGVERVASHVRSYEERQFILDPYHYIPLLEQKPGGIHNARPFRGQPWGPEFDRMHTELKYRYDGAGTKKYVNILLLFAQHPEAEVKQAVHQCLLRGAYSDEAVRSVLNYVPPRKIGCLDLSQRPELALQGTGTRSPKLYNRLLACGEAV